MSLSEKNGRRRPGVFPRVVCRSLHAAYGGFCSARSVATGAVPKTFRLRNGPRASLRSHWPDARARRAVPAVFRLSSATADSTAPANPLFPDLMKIFWRIRKYKYGFRDANKCLANSTLSEIAGMRAYGWQLHK